VPNQVHYKEKEYKWFVYNTPQTRTIEIFIDCYAFLFFLLLCFSLVVYKYNIRLFQKKQTLIYTLEERDVLCVDLRLLVSVDSEGASGSKRHAHCGQQIFEVESTEKHVSNKIRLIFIYPMVLPRFLEK
jgi:hypothetical protein